MGLLFQLIQDLERIFLFKGGLIQYGPSYSFTVTLVTFLNPHPGARTFGGKANTFSKARRGTCLGSGLYRFAGDLQGCTIVAEGALKKA